MNLKTDKQLDIVKDQFGNKIFIIEKLCEFREQDIFCDVTIRCDDERTFDAHRLVLAAASPYFRAMFQNNMTERSQHIVHLQGVDSASLNALIDYAYTANIGLNVDTIANLLSTANMLRFEEVEKVCVEFLCKNLNVTNCVDVCAIADTLNLEELHDITEVYMTKHFRWLVKHSKFSAVTPKQLESVISSDRLRVSCETEVFKAVLSWVRFEPEARLKYLAGLLRHVRLTLLSRKYLIDIVMREPLVMDDYECRTQVLATLDHFLLPERRKTTCQHNCIPRNDGDKILFVIGGQGLCESIICLFCKLFWVLDVSKQ